MQDRLLEYHKATQEIPTNILAIIPVFLIYNLGLLYANSNARSGIDAASDLILSQWGTTTYVIIVAAIATAGIAYSMYSLRGMWWNRVLMTLPLFMEALVYALCLSAVVGFVLDEWVLLSLDDAASPLLDRAVMATGAGLYEELVFRLMLVPLLAAIAFYVLAMPKPVAMGTSVIVAALVFAGAHHLGNESFEASIFAYRAVAGTILGLLMVTRGFGIAVWTHTSYDFYVAGLA